jgi:diguanylate cyclase (GGDEF)-like protein
MASLQINGIVRSREGVLWIPTSDGLFRLVGSELKRYGQKEGLRDVRVRQVRELKDGRLLVGSQDGLYELRGDHLLSLGLDSGLTPGMDITAIGEMRNGELVIGTLSEELFMFDGRRWQKFGREQGFPANAPFFITEDDLGFLWAAGIRGVERAPLAEMRRLARGEIKTVATDMVLNERGDRRSGQQGFCCNGAGNSKGFMDKAGSLWLPTRDGVVTLDTHGIVKNEVPPTVVIERLQYLNEWHDVKTGEALKLAKNARDLAFEFTALSFQDPASVELQYRLLGYDSGWRDLTVLSPRAINYTNLPAGAYTFEVRAMNNADVWNIAPAGLNFTIKPYFYETGWFYFFLVVFLAVLVYGGFRLQRRAHMKQRALLEQQVAERTQQLHEVNLQLETASLTDPLTGLRNRRYLSSQIPVDLAFYDRERMRIGKSDHALLFALVDLDHFKRINDTYGHKAGDMVLQQFSERMTRLVRVGDYVVRWGGEEFLLVFRPVEMQFVTMLGERIRRSVADQVFDLGEGVQVTMTCSIGLSECALFRDEQHPVGWEQMIELADASLYWVKGHERNGWAALRPTAQTNFTTVIGRLKNGAQALIDDNELSIITSSDAVQSAETGS